MTENLHLGATGHVVYGNGGVPLAMYAEMADAQEAVNAVNWHREKVASLKKAIADGLTSVPCPHCESAATVPTESGGGPSGMDWMLDIRLGHIAVCHPEHYAEAASKRRQEIFHAERERERQMLHQAKADACAASGHGMVQGLTRDWEIGSDGIRCQNCWEMIDFELMAQLKIPGWRFGENSITFSSTAYAEDLGAN